MRIALTSVMLAVTMSSSMGFAPAGNFAGLKGNSMRMHQHKPAGVIGARMQGNPSNKDSLPVKAVAASIASLVTSLPVHAETLAAQSVDPQTREVLVYLAKTLIAWGVPVFSIGVVAFFVISAASRGRRNDMNEEDLDQGKGSPLQALIGGKPPGGEPLEYLKIQRLNDKLDSFQYSLTKAEKGKKAALSMKRKTDFERAYGIALGDVSQEKMAKLAKAHSEFLQNEERGDQRVDQLMRELRSTAAKKSNSTSGGFPNMMMGKDASQSAGEKLEKAIAMSIKNEVQYIAKVSELLSETERDRFVQVLKTRRGGAGWNAESPLTISPSDNQSPEHKPHVFVVDFPGDVTASQVEGLREEVTAIVGWANATRGDRVLLVLNSGGGTVTGYGLAAAQLKRIKAAGMHLTVCVEQVAASGGYMMACTGDHICASPFAVLGSIGVITEIPNVYERLTKEGISFNTITAGKFKRTLTPTKKATKEDIEKTKQDIEQILVLFKNFVASNRPQLDIDNVATGETWFGPDALENKLVDELVTADDKLLELRNVGCELLSVKYDDPRRRKGALGSLLPSGDSGSNLADIMSGLIAISRLAKSGGDVAGLGSITPSSGRTNSVADEYMAADPRDYQDYRM